jgi:2-octaprenyl-6-methoxyphenol hydroxylase
MSDAGDGTIAIVGAGLAGLAAAALLASSGRPVVLVGPPFPPGDTRTTALLDGSIQLLDAAGLWEEARPFAAPLRTMSIVDATSRLVRALPVSFEAGSVGLDAFGWNIPNADLARTIEAHLTGMPNVVRRTESVHDLRPGLDDVALSLSDGTSLSALLVVAADGRNSMVREAAGLSTRTWSYPQVALALNLRHARPHRDTSTEFHTEGGPMTLVPLPGRRSSLVGVVPPSEAERLAGLDEAEFALDIERRCHSLLGRFELDGPRSFWPLSGLASESLTRGRVALIGEAAHVMPPIGAQGFNLTMRDIAALRDATGRGADPGAPSVLSSYEAQRRLDVGTRTAAVDALNRSLLSDFLPVQVGRGLGLYLLDRVAPLRRQAIRLGLAPSVLP